MTEATKTKATERFTRPVVAEYVWIDGFNHIRSKTRVIWDIKQGEDPKLLDRDWSFDGSSTGQATGNNSDCILKPVHVIGDPIRASEYGFNQTFIVMCEVHVKSVDSDELIPHETNNRAKLRELSNKYGEHKCLFGIEQEYTMFKDNKPLGFPNLNYQPAKQGPYYCGVGIDEVFGDSIMEEHLRHCINAGIKISGTNAEVMPGQWEFQIGPLDPLAVSDQIWLARYLLYRTAAKFDVAIKLHPKPVPGDWNGAGAHTNFSTKEMRAAGGIEKCKEVCKRFGDKIDEHLAVYGKGIELRLTGDHETCSYKHFKWGIGDRTASIRIPLHVAQAGMGYIEDRRPNSNIDPYLVTARIVETACDPNWKETKI